MSNSNIIKELQEKGAHFAYSKSKRHPSAASYILGRKDSKEIFDLEKTLEKMDEAKKLIKETLEAKKDVLFVGTKNEAKAAVKKVAESLSMPYVNIRFVGGTITNFPEIKKRLSRLLDLEAKFAAGNLEGYTKKEKLQLERELNKLNEKFGGIKKMSSLPALLVVVDPKHEEIAVKEAKDKGIKVVAIANNDCNYDELDLAIPANDSSKDAIEYILDYITKN